MSAAADARGRFHSSNQCSCTCCQGEDKLGSMSHAKLYLDMSGDTCVWDCDPLGKKKS